MHTSAIKRVQNASQPLVKHCLSFCVSDPLGCLICGCHYTPSSLEPAAASANPKIIGAVGAAIGAIRLGLLIVYVMLEW